MYVRIVIAALFLSLFGGSAFAKGGFVIWSSDSEHFHKVADLPNTPEYQIGDDYIDIGILYKGVELFFIPIWQHEKRYVGLIPNEPDSYYDIPEEELRVISKSAGISLKPAEDVKLSFWTAWGGKLILAGALLLVIVAYIVPDGKDEDEGENQSESS